jgi:hypothetical protein
MPDSPSRLDDSGGADEAAENDVDVKALSPWPRLRGRPRRITNRQVFARCWAVLGVAYVALAILFVFEPWKQKDPFQEGFISILLVVMPILAILVAALTALVLSTVWWFCWASWNPHVSDLPATPAAPPR